MSLSSEIPSQIKQPEFSSCGSAIKANEYERRKIQVLTKKFLRKKGRITELGSGKDLIIDPVVAPDFKPPKTAPKKVHPIQSPITLVPYKNRCTNKSKHGQNIRANKYGTAFWVQIGAVELGRGENLTKEEAIEIRDKYRDSCGLPAVDY